MAFRNFVINILQIAKNSIELKTFLKIKIFEIILINP